MSKMINEIGHVYGKLTVIEKGGKSSNGHQRWICRCECGNLYDAEGSKLRNGTLTHCGCSFKNIKDEIGNRYGRLTVIEKTDKRNGRAVIWKCQCDCGNIVEVIGRDLRQNKTLSCGCLNRELTSKRQTQDELGNRYGKLLVLERKGQINGLAAWLCQCDCRNQVVVKGADLRNGRISCGCVQSKGEQKIHSILQRENINFVKEKSFIDLVSSKKGHPRFDFALYQNNELKGLIEFQGEQHYIDKGEFGKQQREETDQLKLDYCMTKNIPFCVIKYNEDIECKMQDF